MNLKGVSLVVIPEEELSNLKSVLQQILQLVKDLQSQKKAVGVQVKNITALEFMAAVRIRRTKFDQLVLNNKIKTIKKMRKIYVPVSEIDRYFSDTSIQ